MSVGPRVGEVRSIYRRGDRVLVQLPSNSFQVEIRVSEVIDGEVWFYGRRGCLMMPFPARCVVRRITPEESAPEIGRRERA